ncbi:adenylate/guanylate cyclase domain-containing protein [Arenibaculum pallidiluteum]|uniref:adenylate/guanylate cyclase domain-containing protein n=1 Tax=Arenibaculum pallidiluteum TaxID=2812559 RepID=UPI001A97337A|nr:adenylate/guanylate cyclase domain-containing protein [Arenibaculum pallidiluteum]
MSAPPLQADVSETRPSGRARRLRLPLAAVLVTGFGALTTLAVATVLALGLVSAGRNTFALLSDKADLALRGVVVRVRHQLDPANAQVAYLNGLVESAVLDTGDRAQMITVLTGALAATPQVTSISFIGPDYRTLRAGRTEGVLWTEEVDQSADQQVIQGVQEARDRRGPYWAPPTWSTDLKTTVLTLRHPVRKGERFAGVLVVAVSLGDLSRFLSELFVDENLSAFVLFDREHVLAHQNLRYLELDLSRRQGGIPLPLVAEVEDPILSRLWEGQVQSPPLGPQTEARLVDVGAESYLFLLRPLEGYGPQPWTVGISVRLDDVGAEIERLQTAALVGIAILLASVAVALLAGLAISRQVARIAAAAASVATLDFRGAPRLPDSRFREISDAAQAFNTMVAGLRWFETYVPKKLVLRLIGQRAAQMGELVSEERQVTVMFTDIRGFSRLAEDLGPTETAALLNQHFGRLAACIEAEGGTVDKFIGDAVMAFWGAPEVQDDQAARALAAARQIALAVAEDNQARAARGEAPVGVRIGLHTGPVIVGNIGSASRLNYTIVGDTVNIAQRIEELAGSLAGTAAEDVLVLCSGVTAAAAGPQPGLEPVGTHRLRGRSGHVELYRLRNDGAALGSGDRPAA